MRGGDRYAGPRGFGVVCLKDASTAFVPGWRSVIATRHAGTQPGNGLKLSQSGRQSINRGLVHFKSPGDVPNSFSLRQQL